MEKPLGQALDGDKDVLRVGGQEFNVVGDVLESPVELPQRKDTKQLIESSFQVDDGRVRTQTRDNSREYHS
jgi:hypothetical protein